MAVRNAAYIGEDPDIAATRVFKALGDPRRYKIFCWLIEKGPRCGIVLAKEMGLRQPNVAQHLNILLAAKLVTREPVGHQLVYRVRDMFVGKGA